MAENEFKKQLTVNDKALTIFDIKAFAEKKGVDLNRLPFSIKVLVENLLRKMDGRVVREEDLMNIARWQKTYDAPVEIPYHPARVLMQDFTGVPAVVDLAAMRDAVKDLGGDPEKINPLVPVELVVDHSIQIDKHGTCDALKKNVTREYERNVERYTLIKWAQKNFDNFNVVPPNSGICHQVNLEHLGRVVISEDDNIAFPDTVVGTDSHTPMINGIGVMGWGVGGIEAEAVMLGQPYYMTIPEVIGVKLVGEPKEGITATDIVLTITQLLREKKVVEKFVEYFGPGVKNLSVTDRATIANMTPEYGATLGFFPIDEKTVDYLKLTNRVERADIVDAYARAQGLFYTGDEIPEYTDVVEFDLSTVEPSLAGPARPQDRIALKDLKKTFSNVMACDYNRDVDQEKLSAFYNETGTLTTKMKECVPGEKCMYPVAINDAPSMIGDGSIVIASITSCTNTSNPNVLIGAGLVAKKAVEKGLKVPSFVKTSLAPGSRVVQTYLEDAGVMPYLEALGFHNVGYGCMTCIGNSGPLNPAVEKAIDDHNLSVASVLSGNRNFEARIHQKIKGNFLASPMLVVAFAIAGRIDVDLTTEPVGLDPNGEPVYLKDIWPDSDEIQGLVDAGVKQELFEKEYSSIFEGDDLWKNLPVTESKTFKWEESSTYIKNPPYFRGFSLDCEAPKDINDSQALLLLGDSVTTDHISPAGAIPEEYPAGCYLKENNVEPGDFNSYGSRRGNHEVMMRGTFGNIRIKNQLVAPKEGSFTLQYPEGNESYIYDAAMNYGDNNVPLIVLGGKEYGTGSSRDWAAKGTTLLGIKAIIAESYERIHRSNLVGMGVLPLIFADGNSWGKLGLKGDEKFSISGIENMAPRKKLQVKAVKSDGSEVTFDAIARLDTDVDVDYFEHGGILPFVLRKIMKL